MFERGKGPQQPEQEAAFVPTEKDIKQWRAGAESFQRFWQSVSKEDKQAFFYSPDEALEDPEDAKGEVQALFLGEKPAVWLPRIPTPTLQASFHAEGLKAQGEIVYHQVLVERVMHEYPKEFPSDVFQTADQVIKYIQTQGEAVNQGAKPDNVRLGLVFGYPAESVRDFEKMQKLRIWNVIDSLDDTHALSLEEQKSIDEAFYIPDEFRSHALKEHDVAQMQQIIGEAIKRNAHSIGLAEKDMSSLMEELEEALRIERQRKGVDVYGVGWRDIHDNPDSREKQARLKCAFETSGILQVA